MQVYETVQNQVFQRYEPLIIPAVQNHPPGLKEYQPCPGLTPSTAYVHVTSKRLLVHPEDYGSFGLALHIACGQQPRLVKSNVNIANFKMMANQPLGCRSRLQKPDATRFAYKWCFLAPTSKPDGAVVNITGFASDVAFELDQLDEALFDCIDGLDLDYVR